MEGEISFLCDLCPVGDGFHHTEKEAMSEKRVIYVIWYF